MSSTTILDALTDPITTKYILGGPIGQPGQFGQAFKITHKKTKEVLAAKKISKCKFNLNATERQFHYKQLRDEIKIMQTIADHPNIIRIHEVFEDKEALWLVLDYCAGGELFDRIREQDGGSYSEHDAAVVLRQMCAGIAHLHDAKIAHCDLKPDNFLFATEEKDAPLKIIDFGMSKTVNKPWKYLTRFRGTPYYVAPEVLQGKYLEHCDMWSFGVVMFVMLFGFPPFHADTDEGIFEQIKLGFDPTVRDNYGAFFPASMPVSENARDLIKKCLNRDTSARLSAREALEHAWLNAGAATTPLAKVMSNLNQFTANTRFKQEVLKLMTNLMTKEDLISLKQTFKSLDANGDGSISAEELTKALKDRPELSKNIDTLLQNADLDGDGNLSYEELLLTSVHRKIGAKEERMFAAFSRFDKDRDGTITADEIQAVLGISGTEAEEMLKTIDTNKDGNIDYEEFSAAMTKREEESHNALLK